jgi:hypothetical protein
MSQHLVILQWTGLVVLYDSKTRGIEKFMCHFCVAGHQILESLRQWWKQIKCSTFKCQDTVLCNLHLTCVL